MNSRASVDFATESRFSAKINRISVQIDFNWNPGTCETDWNSTKIARNQIGLKITYKNEYFVHLHYLGGYFNRDRDLGR